MAYYSLNGLHGNGIYIYHMVSRQNLSHRHLDAWGKSKLQDFIQVVNDAELIFSGGLRKVFGKGNYQIDCIAK
jgi:hypothetical protein